MVWFGVPLLAFLAPYVARFVEAMATALRAARAAVSVACSANRWPTMWALSVRAHVAYRVVRLHTRRTIRAAHNASSVQWRRI